eukprot:TRINITY_DN7248_c0_g1_i1.p1 TRINITY_DN7248_c0_g1~~TRINITY_DN7248_c0_g1_i1.p1  ORF type:complete len:1468 (+),score=271.04 TRINITY_DN7248_c0_g1_i1:61-4464(+)
MLPRDMTSGMHPDLGELSEFSTSKRQKILSNEILIGIRKDASKELTKRLEEGSLTVNGGHRYQRLSENERKYRESLIQEVLSLLDDRLAQVDPNFTIYLREEFLVKKFGDWKRSKRMDAAGFGPLGSDHMDIGAFSTSFPAHPHDEYRHDEHSAQVHHGHSMIEPLSVHAQPAGAGNRQYIFDNTTPSSLSMKESIPSLAPAYPKTPVHTYSTPHPHPHPHPPSQVRLAIVQQPISQVVFRDRQIYAPYVVKLEFDQEIEVKSRGKIKAFMVVDRPNPIRMFFDEREISPITRDAVFENIIVKENKSRKVFLEFTADVVVGNETYTITSEPSSALVVVTHSLQWPEAAREAFMHDTFRNELQSIDWAVAKIMLNRHFAKATGQTYDSPKRLLSEQDLALLKKLFCEPQTDTVTTSSFQKGWVWFGPVLYAIHKEKNKALWFDGIIAGFVTYNAANDILDEFPPGSFLVRFSLHKTSNLVISYSDSSSPLGSKPDNTHVLVPNDTLGPSGNIADLMSNAPEFQDLHYIIKYDANSERYVSADKDTFLSSHRTRRETLTPSTLPQGYVLRDPTLDIVGRSGTIPLYNPSSMKVWENTRPDTHRFSRADFTELPQSIISTGFNTIRKVGYHGKTFCLKEPTPFGELSGDPRATYFPTSAREYDEVVLKMFKTEATVLSYLGHHKYIVSFFGIIANEMTPGLVLEYAELGNLQNAIRNDFFQDNSTARVRIASQVAEAIEFLHKSDVVHGDIRPENVLLFRENSQIVPKLADFGLATCPKLFTTCREVAYFKYAAPEVLKGRNQTQQSDIYSFGVLVWSLFAGEEPYASSRVEEVLQFLESGKHLQMQGIPAELDPMLKACWSLVPSKRPSATDVLSRLSFAWTSISIRESGQHIGPPIAQPFIVIKDLNGKGGMDTIRSTCSQIYDVIGKGTTLRDQLSSAMIQRERAWGFPHAGGDHISGGLIGSSFKANDYQDIEHLRVRLNTDDESLYNNISNLYEIFSKDILDPDVLEYWSKTIKDSLIMRHQIAIFRRDASSDPKTSPKDTLRFIIDDQPCSQVLLKTRKDEHWKIFFKNHPTDGKFSLKLLRGSNQAITGVGNLKIFVTCDNKTISSLDQNCVICWQGKWSLQADSQTVTVDVESITIREQKVRKICLHFCVEVVAEGKRIQILSDPSNPMLLITHSSQWSDAFRDIVVDESFAHKDIITFETLANVLTRHFVHSLSTADESPDRPLSREDLEFIHTRKLDGKSTVGREKFLSFWIYFGTVMSTLRKERIRKLWTEGLIFPFLDINSANDLLSSTEAGTAMLRLSSSKPGCLVLSVRKTDDIIIHIMIHPDKIGYRRDVLDVLRLNEFSRLMINGRPSHYTIRREFLLARFAASSSSSSSALSASGNPESGDDFTQVALSKTDSSSRRAGKGSQGRLDGHQVGDIHDVWGVRGGDVGKKEEVTPQATSLLIPPGYVVIGDGYGR